MFYRGKLQEFLNDEIQEKRKKVLILDGHSLIFRTLFVGYDPEDVKFDYWKYLVINSLFSAIKKFEPSKVIFALDSQSYWRKKVYPLYKAHRKLAREKSKINFEAFWPIMNEFMIGLQKAISNVYFMKIDECEADDIIAVLSRNIFKKHKVTIIATDGDFRQLLKYKNVEIYDPIKKKIVKSINFKKELEIKILTGETGDNIPGIKPQVGPVTAQKILKEGLDEHLKDKEIKKNYLRNQKLINFDFIPKEIENKIEDQYNKYDLKTFNSLTVWHFFIKNRVRKFADDLGIYSPFMKDLT